jgi:hypothetical protein
MRSQFVIFSLPRSGSSWLSLFLSAIPGFCFHEPLADGGVDSLRPKLASRPEPSVGFIDTSAYQNRNEVLRALPLARTFVLLRDPAEVEASILRNLGPFDMGQEYERFVDATGDFSHIYYENLHDLDYLKEIWTQIIGPGFDKQRAEYLIEMKVQRDPQAVITRFRRTQCH